MNKNSWIRSFYYALGPKNMRRIRRILYIVPDFIDWLFQRRPIMVPPRGMVFTGGLEYVKQGDRFLQLFKEAGMQPQDNVLDIGCGIGRMARPLTGYLKNPGKYHGVDIVEVGIDWCKKHIQSRFPDFEFTCLPLQNNLYRKEGNRAEEFRFPFEENQFDFIFLTSVFTHMPEKEVLHYLDEIHRMLKPGGICLSTFFLLDDFSRAQMLHGGDVMQFPHDFGSYALHHLSVDAANIAFDKKQLLTRIQGPFNVKYDWPGRWCQRPGGVDFQDILVLEKSN